MSFKPTELIVQKYGGATLADPEKIKAVAQRIANQAKESPLLVVVSAMGATTNQLIDLAHQVSPHPQRRELDMLLSVGERISMSLMSMALNDLGCSAISFTGSQAGILTDESHVNAFIIDVKPVRVQEALEKNQIVILAGFQGVSPTTKEITTLGRGGSDTTAVAMAGHFGAKRCEILKDVSAVFTADPKIVNQAQPLNQLNYEQLFEMTFWGAKVLHYRSVELAKQKNVSLYIGPASNKTSEGTLVQKNLNFTQEPRALSVNSHETVLQVNCSEKTENAAIQNLFKILEKKQVAAPQVLHGLTLNNQIQLLITGPQEIINSTNLVLREQNLVPTNSTELSTVTLTYTGALDEKIKKEFIGLLKKQNLSVIEIINSSCSLTAVIHKKDRIQAIQSLHQLIN